MAPPTVYIDKDRKTFIYKGKSVPMTNFKYFVESVTQDASDLLFKKLLFSPGNLSTLIPDLKKLTEDSPNTFLPGYSFLSEPENASILKPGFTDIIGNLEADPNGGRAKVCRREELSLNLQAKSPRKSLVWQAAVDYEESADRFLELLLVTILVTSFNPPYGEDLLHVNLVNRVGVDDGSNVTIVQRGVRLRNGKVVVMTKNGHPTDGKPVFRFLSDSVGRLVILYIADVLPLRREFPLATAGSMNDNNYLFAPRFQGEGRWSMEKYDRVMRQETKNRMGVEMNLEEYKALFLAMANTWMPGYFDADGYRIN